MNSLKLMLASEMTYIVLLKEAKVSQNTKPDQQVSCAKENTTCLIAFSHLVDSIKYKNYQ